MLNGQAQAKRNDLIMRRMVHFIAGPEVDFQNGNRPYYKMELNKASEKTGDIYIYDVVGGWDGTSARQFATDLNALGKLDTLNVFINSPGGSVFEGVAIYNTLVRNRAKKIVQIDGLAGSIASIIAMAGDEIIIAKNGYMMIHNPFAMAIGYASELRAVADRLDKMRETLLETYVDRSSSTAKQIGDWMDAETWLNAEETVAAGLADKVSAVEVALAALAKYDLTKMNFRNVPKNVLEFRAKAQTNVADTSAAAAGAAEVPTERKPHPAVVKASARVAAMKRTTAQ